MNKKIAMSVFSIVAALSVMGGATFAFFSDTGTSTGNTFSTGEVDLRLTDSDQTDQDTVTASFGGATLLSPGTCLATQTLNLKNSGTVAANHADLSAVNSNGGLANVLRLNVLMYDGVDMLAALTDSNANGIKDLGDLQGAGLNNLALTDLNQDHPLNVQVCLDSSATNTVKGQTNTMDMTVFLDQGPH